MSIQEKTRVIIGEIESTWSSSALHLQLLIRAAVQHLLATAKATVRQQLISL